MDAALRTLLEAPDDDERWAVYADCLQAAGDVRGEIISLELDGSAELAERAAALTQQYQREVLSDLLREAWYLGWRRGHIVSAEFRSGFVDDENLLACLTGLLDLEVSAFLEKLVVHEPQLRALLEPVLVRLVAMPRPALIQVELVETGKTESISVGVLAPLLNAHTLPRLAALHLGFNFAEPDAVVTETLSAAPLVGQLQSLGLYLQQPIDDATRDAFSHLALNFIAPAARCPACEAATTPVVMVLADSGIPHGHPGHSVVYREMRVHRCECGAVFAFEVDHDCFDYEDTWTIVHVYWVAAEFAPAFLDAIAVCETPMHPTCSCPTHTELRRSLHAARMGAIAHTQGYGGVHEVRMEATADGLPRLVLIESAS